VLCAVDERPVCSPARRGAAGRPWIQGARLRSDQRWVTGTALGAAVCLLAVAGHPGAARAVLTPGGDHRGTAHVDHDHAGEDLTAVDLSPDPDDGTPSDLSWADFTAAILDDADLEGVFGGCETDAPPTNCTDFTGASLVDADLTGAVLPRVVLAGADATGALFVDAELVEASAPGLVLDGARLSYADWTGAVLNGADLTFADGVETELGSADLSGATLVAADLPLAGLAGAMLVGADATGATLSGADLTGADATGSIWTGAGLEDVVLVDALLRSTVLDGADLSGADARCAGAVAEPPVDDPPLDGCTDWGGVSLRFAILVDVFFQGALLTTESATAVDLFDADLRRGDFSGACFTTVSTATVPTGECVAAAPSPPARLAFAAVDGARFDGAVMVGVDAESISGGCVPPRPGDPDTAERCPSFVGADLRLADLSGARLDEGDFGAADLSGADLTGADLSGAVLVDVIADGADFTSSVLAEADLGGARFDGATFAAAGSTVVMGGDALCTPGAGESPVDLVGADLVGADFSTATNFHAGCIVVDETTTFDSGSTALPPGFALREEMTDVPEPGVGVLHGAALAVIGLLARRRNGPRAGRGASPYAGARRV